MSTTTMRGQFLKGHVQTIRASSKRKLLLHDNNMSGVDSLYRINSSIFRANGRILPKRGAI